MFLNENIKSVSPAAVTVRKRTEAYLRANPSKTLTYMNQPLINMPLPKNVTEAMKRAVDEISSPNGAFLNAPWDGYPSLKSVISMRYSEFGLAIPDDSVLITGGIETAVSSVSELFSEENTVLLPDPCERSLRDVHIIAGRTVKYMRATPENDFLPMPDGEPADIICLSNPNTVTGACYTKEQLAEWVDFANTHGSIIIYDSSFSPFIGDREKYPLSIYTVPGAFNCAVEIFSFDEGFGVPELKLAYTVIPQTLIRASTKISEIWFLHQHSNASPASYVMQKACETLLSRQSRKETLGLIRNIKDTARMIAHGLEYSGISSVGADNSPFVWAKCPEGISSWRFFDLLLDKAGIVVTPGSFFGHGGESYFRLTAFGTPSEASEATAAICRVSDEEKEKTPPPVPKVDIFEE